MLAIVYKKKDGNTQATTPLLLFYSAKEKSDALSCLKKKTKTFEKIRFQLSSIGNASFGSVMQDSNDTVRLGERTKGHPPRAAQTHSFRFNANWLHIFRSVVQLHRSVFRLHVYRGSFSFTRWVEQDENSLPKKETKKKKKEAQRRVHK